MVEINKIGRIYIINESLQRENNPVFFVDFLNPYCEFSFGKYKGFPLEYVFQNDAPYLAWCIRNISNFMVTEEEIPLILKKLQKEWNFDKKQIIEIKKANDIKLARTIEILIRTGKINSTKYFKNDNYYFENY
jgi:hypothetical protein